MTDESAMATQPEVDAPVAGSTRRRGDLIVISRHWVVGEPTATSLYEMMLRCYEEHRTGSPFRYVWHKDEWMAMMAHPQVMKLVASVDGVVSGVMTGVFNEAMRDVGSASVDHSEHRNPGRTVICQEDTFVDVGITDRRVFTGLVKEGLRFAKERDAVVVFSTSQTMVERGYVRLLQRLVKGDVGAPIVETGAQRYYEFDTRPPDDGDGADGVA